MRNTILSLCFCLLAAVGCADLFTVANGSFAGNIDSWTAYQCTAAYQPINSPNDPVSGSGSALITSSVGYTYCSFWQDLGITAQGQTVTIYADVAWDGDWDYIYFGFYLAAPTYDRVVGASVDISTLAPADTDGTLDKFTRVQASGTLPTTGEPIYVWIGSACTPYSGGPKTQGTSKFAIDNVSTLAVTPTPTPSGMTAVSQCWDLYE
jgi:hypothetical protein